MNDFIEFLKFTKDSLENVESVKHIHIVIGNESCDLDSTVSSVVLAYFLVKHKIRKIPSSALIVPVQNVSRDNFLLRTETCLVLKEAGIPLDLLVYRDQVDFKELLRTKTLTSSLVDHHVLSINDLVLKGTILQIFDHRPRDSQSKWDQDKIRIKIQEVGSCSTLIAEEVFSVDESILFKELAFLLYEAIIFDTIALLPENGKAKELDLSISKKLEDKFQFDDDKKALYNKLWTAHNNVSHLSPRQILMKDLKIVEGVPVPGIALLVEEFLKMDSYKSIVSFADDYKVSLIVLIGLDATNEVKRDIALYWKSEGTNLKNVLLHKLKNSQQLNGHDFAFSEVHTSFDDIVCLRQKNVKLSRKQIVPLVRDAVLENN